MVDNIDNTILSNVAGSNIVVTDVLAQGVFPSTMPSGCNYNLNTRTVTCNAGSLNIAENKSFSFNVLVYNSSLTHLNEIAYVNYTNYQNINSSFLLNNPNVTVLGGVNSCIGNIAPILTIISPVSGLYNNSLMNVRINAVDSNLANVWYSLNGVNTTYTGEFNINLSNNIYQLTAYANDSCGSLGSTSVVFRVNTSSNSTNSTIGPNVTIISPLAQTYNTSLILFNVTAIDDIAVSHIWCTLDGVSFNNCTNSFILNLSNGYHTFLAYANDSDGNQDWDGVTFLVNYSNNGNQTNPTNSTNYTHVHNASCANTHAPVNDFDYNETADSISMDDNFVVALNYVNSSEETGFSMESYLSGEENSLIFNMILLIAIIILLLIIVLVGKKN